MKDNRQRLFELMQRVNPDFVIKEANPFKAVAGAVNKVTGAADDAKAAAQTAAGAALTDNYRLETYGDLLKIVNVITQFKSGKIDAAAKIGGKAISALLGLIPGAGTVVAMAGMAAEGAGLLGDIFRAPDDKKTGTWLDKLNLDDELSAIVDDTVENGFLNDIIQRFKSENPEAPLPTDFNINTEMVEFLKEKYGGRTIAGVPSAQNTLTSPAGGTPPPAL